jgi:predicted NAD-dependent protein-ADP-ribosyltransferase YbiA (DUF1768 family)
MLQCLIIKTQQNYTKIRQIIELTNELPIVEYSRKDPFWGAQPDGECLVGCNVLGKLWMFVRPDILDGSIRCTVADTSYFPQGDDQLVDIIQY